MSSFQWDPARGTPVPRPDMPDYLEREGVRDRLAGVPEQSLAIAAFAYLAVVGGIALVLLVLAISSRDLGDAREDHAAGGAQAQSSSVRLHSASVIQTGRRDHGR